MFSNCTVIVNSSDKYDDTWFPFFELFKKYWTNCDCEIILNTESKRHQHEGLNVRCLQLYDENQVVAYGERLLAHLGHVQTPYVIMLLDDFFLHSPVDEGRIKGLIDIMEREQDIATFIFEEVDDESNIDDKKVDGFVLRSQVSDYKFTLQGALWRKDKLISLIKPHEDPWGLEIYGTMRASKMYDRFYCLKKQEETPINYGKKEGLSWGIVRGKWADESIIQMFKENGITVDYSKRGFLTKEDLEMAKRNARKFNVISVIKSLGVQEFIRYLYWRLIRHARFKLGIPLGDKYSQTYASYYRKKFVERKRSKNVL